MTARLENERFVGYWADVETHEVLFTMDADWTRVRDALQYHVRDTEDEREWIQLSALFPRVKRSQGGFERTAKGPQPGAFSATVLGDPDAADTLVVLKRPGNPRPLPLVSTAETIDRELATMRRQIPDLVVDRATLTDDPFRVPGDIATGARKTTAAIFAFHALRGGANVRKTIEGMGVAELIWLGYEIGRVGLNLEFEAIATAALNMERSASTLNLCGSAHRRDWHTQASEDCYRESIKLVSSARQNPYGWIGLGATLRRRWEHDEAYNCAKRVLKYYPNNRYALSLKNALMGEMGDVRMARGTPSTDETTSLIPDLPFIDSMPWDSEMTAPDDVPDEPVL